MIGKALIVDDSLVARISMKAILKETGLSIEEAGSGEAALEKLEAGDAFDIVFLDLTMPGKGGIETLREIVASRPGLPVAVVTADIQGRTIDTVRGLGAAAVVRKPADKAEILEVLLRFVEGNGAS
jgi:two-component system, chemotaxis family, chemotaxis protein CheY